MRILLGGMGRVPTPGGACIVQVALLTAVVAEASVCAPTAG